MAKARIWRWAWRLSRWLTLALVTAGIVAAGRLWVALPQVSGTMRAPGIGAPVDILRDEFGIPHIRAASEPDLMFALGVVHAQDRLWQMEFQRRLGSGRLSELLGDSTVPTDRLFRTLGLRRAAEAAWPALLPETQRLIEKYVEGINHVLGSRSKHRLPIEFALFQLEPEPFTPVDVLLWPKVMAWTLSTNFRDELLRARLVARVGADGADALMPAYSDEWPVILPAGAGGGPPPPTDAHDPARAAHSRPVALDQSLAARVARLAVTIPEAPLATAAVAASNNWVIAGRRTTSGKPLLANDPHLAARLPSTWYLVHLDGGRIQAVGASLPGTPGIVIGHNARIAWGLTNLMTDVQDLYVERLNARGEVEYDGTWQAPRLVRETIQVRGGRSLPLLVRETRHGPIISDVVEPAPTEALALRWVALDPGDTTLDALIGVLAAGDWRQFGEALRGYRVPIQNWVYADVDGHIGYFAPGLIPIRARGDGRLPVPGWTSEYEWKGFVPADQLPRTFDPPQGYVVTANNKALGDAHPYLISTNWEAGYRAARIVELIEARERLTLDDLAAIQADVTSLQVRAIMPWLRRAQLPPGSRAAREALDRLATWNGSLDAGSAEAAIFMAWYDELTRALFEDDLGEALWRDYQRLPHWAGKALHAMVRRNDAAWCDDRRTEPVESCEQVLGQSLVAAVERLAALHGTDHQSTWRWGRSNRVTFGHLPLDAIPMVRRLFSRGAEHHGHFFTVSPTMRVEGQTMVASYRQLVDLGNLDGSRFVHPLGQSGQLLSGHYDDLHETWRAVRYLPMRFSREAVDAAVVGRLRLVP